MKKPRCLIYDLEITPLEGWAYGTYQTNIMGITKVPIIMSIAYKWHGEKKLHVKTLSDFPSYKKDIHNDYELTKFISELIEEADILVGHNCDGFDNKVTNTRMIYHGFQPPRYYKTVDTLKLARRYFKFPNNKLDTIARFFDYQGKTLSHGSLWEGCYNGDMKMWKLMKEYNKYDVVLHEFVYEKLRSWGNHPNMNVYSDIEGCTVCSSQNYKENEKRATNTGLYQGYKCLDCGKRFQGKKNLLKAINLR